MNDPSGRNPEYDYYVHVDRYPSEDAARTGVQMMPGHQLVQRLVSEWTVVEGEQP